METFLREPTRLAAEQRRIEGEMVQASLAHYPVFIQSAARCGDALREVERDSQIVERLRLEEQALRRRLAELADRGEEWKRGRQQLLVLRSSQERLRELFELPSLLESCLRNELYHEAILLHDKVEQLLQAGSDLPALRLIADEVEETMRKHLPQVIGKLAMPLTPAQCLKVVRFLSRLHIMGDREQRKLFLSRRLAYLQSLLNQERQRSAFAYLNRACNVMGQNLQGVINEYKATFEDKGYQTLSAYDTDKDIPACDVLGAWVSGVVDDYVAILQKHLPLVTGGGELRALLEQAMQTGARLSKHGVDLRPVLADLFQRRVLAVWGEGIKAAYAAFTLALGNHQWGHKHSCHQQVLRAGPAAEPQGITPPHVLHQFLPLAYLCNGVLSTLNELRRCALVAAAPEAARVLAQTLQRAVGDVVQLHADSALDEQETTSFAAFCKVMGDELLPYLARCFGGAFAGAAAVPARDLARPLADIYRPHLQRPPAGEQEGAGEALGAGSPAASPPARLAALRRVFSAIDSNGDGSISRSELSRALRSDPEVRAALGAAGAPTPAWAERLFQRLDGDRDGTISWSELERYIVETAADGPGPEPSPRKRVD
eukprot:TRINITY_DN47139_c0_g1_i1.p2 TRINITY_DN47139_c0_g1~~TRINITY_DN47139_c0_g1_i1.p2  ORF type:complete len:631 (+),score=251.05 TRINITY_DN47139_c0_g1_i1:88-1893(+)